MVGSILLVYFSPEFSLIDDFFSNIADDNPKDTIGEAPTLFFFNNKNPISRMCGLQP
jgi:hypothetical protein